MNNYFMRMPFSVSNPNLPVIPPGDIDPLDKTVEAGADDHWIFGSSAESLTGLSTGRSLDVVVGSASYSENFVSLSGPSGTALVSNIFESSSQTDTICAVMRLPQINALRRVLFGTLSDSSASIFGCGPFLSTDAAGKVYVNARTITGLNYDTGTSISSGEWFFMALSRDFSGPDKTIRYVLNDGFPIENQGSGSSYLPAPAPNGIAVGGAYYDSAATAGDYAEFIVIPRAMNAAELQALYQRRKGVMASRGIHI